MDDQKTSDLLYGYDAIGAFLGMTERQAKHLATLDAGPPTFHLGRRVCARKSALNEWLSKQEGRGHE